MKRIKDGYLEKIQTVLSFTGKKALEVCCGDGSRTVQIASCCADVIAIDPSPVSLAKARSERTRPNIEYHEGSADHLSFADTSFDIVFFTLSFHHVPVEQMGITLNEALRVLKNDGFVIFLEPAFDGSFFDAEITFDACDGDERKEKAFAYGAMLAHQQMQEIKELADETIFEFESVEDYKQSMNPKKGTTEQLVSFLASRNFTLTAQRRINIFRKK